MPDLRKYDDAWNRSDEVPDGEWDCTIESVYFSESKSGKPMLNILFMPTHPQWAGVPIRYRKAITEKTVGWIRGDLKKLGFDVEKFSLSQLEENEGLRIQLKGKPARVRKQPQANNPDFSEIRILTRPEPEPEAGPEIENDTAELPESPSADQLAEKEPWDEDKEMKSAF